MGRRQLFLAVAIACTLLVSLPLLCSAQDGAASVNDVPSPAPETSPTVPAVTSDAPTDSEGDDTARLIPYYRAHAWLMWIAFGLLMPTGVLIAAYLQSLSDLWFTAHRSVQTLAVALVVTSFAIACAKFDALLDSLHSRLGIAVFVFVCLQPALAVFRPAKGTWLRVAWFCTHWVLGMSTLALGWCNLLLGLDLMADDLGFNPWPWYAALGANVLVFCAAYVVLARWDRVTAQLQGDAAGPSSGKVAAAAAFPAGLCSFDSGENRFDCLAGHGVGAQRERFMV